MKTAPLPSKSSGCAVVLEPESSWPARAFAATPDRDCVVVMHDETGLNASLFVDRFVTHSAEFERSGAKLRTVILACRGSDRESNARRAALVKALLPLLTSGEARLVLTSDSSTGPSNDELLEFIGTMLSELQGRSITFVANDQEVVSFAPGANMDSGFFSIAPATYPDLNPHARLHDAEQPETIGFAS